MCAKVSKTTPEMMEANEAIVELVAPVELTIITPASTDAIVFNADELKGYISESLKVYTGLIVTPENLKSAAAAKTRLGKLRKEIEDRRIEIKKASAKPYDKFALQVAEIVKLIDAPILAIDKQVKAFEDAEKAAKKAAIEAFYAAHIGDIKELLTFDRLYDERWMLKGEKLADILQELGHKIDKAREGLKAIDDMVTPHAAQLRAVYLKTLDLGDVMVEKGKLDKQEAALAEVKRAREEAAAAFAVPKPAQVAPPPLYATPAPTPELPPVQPFYSTPQPMAQPAPLFSSPQPPQYVAGETPSPYYAPLGTPVQSYFAPPQPARPTYAIDLRVFVNDDQARALTEYLRVNGIQYSARTA